MGYNCGDSFSFDFESNRTPFGSQSKGKLSPRLYPIQFDRNWKHIFLNALGELRPPPRNCSIQTATAVILIDYRTQQEFEYVEK